MTAELLTKAGELVLECIEFTSKPESRAFYFKSIFALGDGLVREAMGETRMREAQGTVNDRAKYFHSILSNWMVERGLSQTPEERESAQVSRGLSQTPSATISFDDFEPVLDDDSTASLIPFRSDVFPWVLHVNNDFFSLTNEKARSDKVSTNVLIGGKSYAVKMIRGKKGRNDDERGIHTTEHMRILMAAIQIWKRRNLPPIRDKSGPYRICVVETTVREIANEMGLGEIGGDDHRRIERKLQDLASSGYTFLLRDVPELRASGLDDKSFQFFGEVDTTGIITNGRREARVKIFFSSRYSEYLLRRQVVTRPIEMIRLRGDMALKISVYLFPILKKQGEHAVPLNELIDKIGLKRTGWSALKGFKSLRKREFEKPVKELNGLPMGDGHCMKVEIGEGLDSKDYLLIARLVPA